MSYKIKLTPTSFRQLSSAFRRIGTYSASQAARDKRIVSISKAISSLDEFPCRYALFDKEPWSSQGIRKMPIEGYVVYYEVVESEKNVKISAIVHGKQDQEKALKEALSTKPPVKK